MYGMIALHDDGWVEGYVCEKPIHRVMEDVVAELLRQKGKGYATSNMSEMITALFDSGAVRQAPSFEPVELGGGIDDLIDELRLSFGLGEGDDAESE